eukprot:1139249-Pelagomonas_calceolata.AAC.4
MGSLLACSKQKGCDYSWHAQNRGGVIVAGILTTQGMVSSSAHSQQLTPFALLALLLAAPKKSKKATGR